MSRSFFGRRLRLAAPPCDALTPCNSTPPCPLFAQGVRKSIAGIALRNALVGRDPSTVTAEEVRRHLPYPPALLFCHRSECA